MVFRPDYITGKNAGVLNRYQHLQADRNAKIDISRQTEVHGGTLIDPGGSARDLAVGQMASGGIRTIPSTRYHFAESTGMRPDSSLGYSKSANRCESSQLGCASVDLPL
jgi:hypothetical protein